MFSQYLFSGAHIKFDLVPPTLHPIHYDKIKEKKNSNKMPCLAIKKNITNAGFTPGTIYELCKDA